ncbi:MAG: ATP-binding protein [bacterium]|nr:ATP-binding protein [bacterium]
MTKDEQKYKKENLHTAFHAFIEYMRKYISDILSAKYGENWGKEYHDQLRDYQKKDWVKGLQEKKSFADLIDYANLKGFAIGFKELLRKDFGNDANNLPTWLYDITAIRNKYSHYEPLENLDFEQAYNNMLKVTKKLKNTELTAEITTLKEERKTAPAPSATPVPTAVETKTEPSAPQGIIPWFKTTAPHIDIRHGRLDESVFAANLAYVRGDHSYNTYADTAIFFKKTYLTMGMKNLARRVIQGLNGGQESENRIITLQTGFGGGKTHTLIALYHLVNNPSAAKETANIEKLFNTEATPKFDNAAIAVFTNTTLDPTQGRKEDNLHIRTMWGELAYQLGGEEAYNIIKENDQNRTAPKGLFKKILAKTKPALILIDELADYCVAAAGVQVGKSSLSDQTISFMQELSEAVTGSDNVVLVATLPASDSEVANSQAAATIFTSLSNRLARVAADTQPVADEEIFQVIRCRLFDQLPDKKIITQCVDAYMKHYNQLRDELPSNAVQVQYKEKLMKAYPFQPELIEMFRSRWASHPDFQRTRGVLRLLASVVADLWRRHGSLTGTNGLIHTSDIRLENLDALTGKMTTLYGSGYSAVVTADVAGPSSNAFKIDTEKHDFRQYEITRGIAVTMLLGSFGSTGPNKGLKIEEIKLCVCKPETYNHNNVNTAIDLLEDSAHYLYYSSAGTSSRRYWFHTKPNINILINKVKKEILQSTIDTHIIEQIQANTRKVEKFNVLTAPSGDVPEQKTLTMIVLHPHCSIADDISQKAREIIGKMAVKKGQSERIYRNTILFLLPNDHQLAQLRNAVRQYLAVTRIIEEYNTQLEKEQLDEIGKKKKEYDLEVEDKIVTTYTTTAKYVAKEGIKLYVCGSYKENLATQLDGAIYTYLKEETVILEAVGMNFLRRNNLLPEPGKPVSVKEIYEAFVRYDDKPLITGPKAVVESLNKYCREKAIVIGVGKKDEYTERYFGEEVTYLNVEDGEYWVLDKSEALQAAAPQPQQPSIPSIYPEPRPVVMPAGSETAGDESETGEVRQYRSLCVSGNVNVENYNQIFQSFIMPLLKNKVKIEIKITGSSTGVSPLTESGDIYKIIRESANQLNLQLDMEE